MSEDEYLALQTFYHSVRMMSDIVRHTHSTSCCLLGAGHGKMESLHVNTLSVTFYHQYLSTISVAVKQVTPRDQAQMLSRDLAQMFFSSRSSG